LRIIFKVTKELPRGSNFSAQREGIRSEDEMEIRPGSQVAMDNGPPSSLSEKAKTLQLGGRSLPPRLKIFKENKRQDRCHYQHFFLSRKSFFLGSISHLATTFLLLETLATCFPFIFFFFFYKITPFILYSTTKKPRPPNRSYSL
jgi:hypothetical protein